MLAAYIEYVSKCHMGLCCNLPVSSRGPAQACPWTQSSLPLEKNQYHDIYAELTLTLQHNNCQMLAVNVSACQCPLAYTRESFVKYQQNVTQEIC